MYLAQSPGAQALERAFVLCDPVAEGEKSKSLLFFFALEIKLGAPE